MGNQYSTIPPEKFKDQIFSIVMYYAAPKSNPDLKFTLREKCTADNLPIPDDPEYEKLLNYYNLQDEHVINYVQKHILNSEENLTRFYQTLITDLRGGQEPKRYQLSGSGSEYRTKSDKLTQSRLDKADLPSLASNYQPRSLRQPSQQPTQQHTQPTQPTQQTQPSRQPSRSYPPLPEASRPEASRPEASRPEASRLEASRPNPINKATKSVPERQPSQASHKSTRTAKSKKREEEEDSKLVQHFTKTNIVNESDNSHDEIEEARKQLLNRLISNGLAIDERSRSREYSREDSEKYQHHFTPRKR